MTHAVYLPYKESWTYAQNCSKQHIAIVKPLVSSFQRFQRECGMMENFLTVLLMVEVAT